MKEPKLTTEEILQKAKEALSKEQYEIFIKEYKKYERDEKFTTKNTGIY